MRFLVDESTGASVAQCLRKLGHDVVAVTEAMPQADDKDIVAEGVAQQRIIVTNDKDFGDLVYRGGKSHAGVVLFRLRDESAANRVAVMERLLQSHGDKLAGSFVVATDTHVRIRK